MFHINKKLALSIVLLWSVWGWYYYSSSSSSSTKAITESDLYTVKTGSIRDVIKLAGSTQLVQSQKLSFGAIGKVTKLTVKAGDIVRKWQVLAELDAKDVNLDLAGQSISLANARNSYTKLFSSTKDYQLVQMENTVKNSEASLARSELEVQSLLLEKDQKITAQENTIRDQKKKIELDTLKISNFKNDVTYTTESASNTVKQSTIDRNNLVTTAKNNAKQIIADGKSYLYDLENGALSFKEYAQTPIEFSAKNSSKWYEARTAFDRLSGKLDSFEVYVNSWSDIWSGKTEELLNKTIEFSSIGTTSADLIRDALEESITSSTFSDGTLSSLKSTTSSARSKFANSETSANNTLKQLVSLDDVALTELSTSNGVASKEQTLKQYENDLITAKNTLKDQEVALEKLKIDYTLKVQQKNDDIEQLKGSLKANKLNSIDLNNWPDATDITSAKNQITQAGISLEKAKQKLDDYKIIAEFDGTVSNVDFDLGENIEASNGITVEVPGIYEVTVALDQLDIVKIDLWQATTIALDAYPDLILTGTVSSIDPTPSTEQWVVSYKAKIILKTEGRKIYNNMSVTTEIILKEKNNILTVPSLAIQTSWTGENIQQFVQTYNNKVTGKKNVRTGLTSGDVVEILSGLTAWDVIFQKKFSVTTATKKGFSLIPTPGSSNRSSNSTRSNSSSPSNDMGGMPPQ